MNNYENLKLVCQYNLEIWTNFCDILSVLWWFHVEKVQKNEIIFSLQLKNAHFLLQVRFVVHFKALICINWNQFSTYMSEVHTRSYISKFYD